MVKLNQLWFTVLANLVILHVSAIDLVILQSPIRSSFFGHLNNPRWNFNNFWSQLLFRLWTFKNVKIFFWDPQIWLKSFHFNWQNRICFIFVLRSQTLRFNKFTFLIFWNYTQTVRVLFWTLEWHLMVRSCNNEGFTKEIMNDVMQWGRRVFFLTQVPLAYCIGVWQR